jgi:hypothetical protein
VWRLPICQASRIRRSGFSARISSRLCAAALISDQPTILEPDRVAVAERGRLVQVEQDVEPAIALEREATAIAILMVERQRLDDLVCFDCSLANDGGGTQHDDKPVSDGGSEAIDRSRLRPLRSPEELLTQAPATLRKAMRCGAASCERSMCGALSPSCSTVTKLTGLGEALMHVIGKAALFAAGGGNTFQGCGNEARPGIRTNAGPCDDDNRI